MEKKEFKHNNVNKQTKNERKTTEKRGRYEEGHLESRRNVLLLTNAFVFKRVAIILIKKSMLSGCLFFNPLCYLKEIFLLKKLILTRILLFF